MMTSRLLPALLLLIAPAAVAQEPTASPPSPEASAKAASLAAGHYKLDSKHTSVVAIVRHVGVEDYLVRFDKFAADLTYDPAHPETDRLEATVDATSLDVGADYSRDFANTFLGAAKNPTMTFVATAMTPNADGRTGTMAGNLTLNGVTRPVTFNVVFNGAGRNFPFGTAAGFAAEGTIKRSDFGSHAWKSVVGDEVQIQIRAGFDKK